MEGLSVAYAIQQNLTHDAESTVWDQGIFELSKTTIESLTAAVDMSDIGIFVFSPDDISIMRESEKRTVRDNVLFEFGLFVGKLGRSRVFFVVPEKSDLRMPTDLLGVTPGTYNPEREDRSLQAATGPVCNQIREAIKKLPLLTSQHKDNESDEAEENETGKYEWLDDLSQNKFSSSREKLQEAMKEKEGKELLEYTIWMAYIDFKEDPTNGLDNLLKLAKSNQESASSLRRIISLLKLEKYNDAALELLKIAIEKFPSEMKFLVLKSECLDSEGDREEAISVLSESGALDNPTIAIALAALHESDKETEKAIKCIDRAHKKYPNNRQVMYKYARLLQDVNRDKEALYLLNELTKEYPQEVAYWGYLSNMCVQLDLYDRAMFYCKKALELSEEKEAWILHNIGNMLNNKGFYCEAVEWLNKGLKIEPASEYAHDRLAGALKSKSDELTRFIDLCNEGRLLLRKYTQNNSQKA